MATLGADSGEQDTSPPLLVVYNFWREFGLESLRPKLDETGLKIAEYQEVSMQNRRGLSEATREFRRKAQDTTVRAVGDLLKQYQQEVDRLTKRAKHGESAFLDLYQQLYEAPDPAQALSSALESASRILQLEAQVRRTAHELGEYQAESKEIKNQELTIRRLEEKIRSLESQLEGKSKELEDTRREATAGAKAEMKDREARLATMLEESQSSLEAMRKLHLASQNQLFSIQSQSEEERAGYRAELDIAASEIERMQASVLALENEKRHLVTELAGVKSNKGRHSDEPNGAEDGPESGNVLEEHLRSELSQLRQNANHLKAELNACRKELEDYRGGIAGRINGMKDALDAKEKYVQSLETELAARPTRQQVDELMQQIQFLQAVQYSSEVDPAVVGESTTLENSAPGVNAFQNVLLQKNRHLEHELTKAKLSLADLRQQVNSAEGTITDLQGQLNGHKDLVVKLEEDLLAAQSPQTEGNDKSGPQHPDRDPLMQGFGQAEETERSQTMVSVLRNQRDRFRRRVQETEEQVAHLQTQLSHSKSEVKSARADNVALVERLKFIQGYQNSQRTDIEVGLDIERKYTKEYEEKMNPFIAFRGQQREIRRKQLGLVDRAVYFVGELVFGNRYARLFVFCYVVVLHILVLATLVYSSSRQADNFLKEEEVEKLCEEHMGVHGAGANRGR